MTDDAELLRRYAVDRSQGTMAELVRRHIGLVYHTALRQCGGDHHRAEDVTQLVFIDLANKAAVLAKHRALTGWLYTSTRYAAVQAVRSEARRQAREQEARLMAANDSDPAAGAVWRQIRPVIDDALGALAERDREALLLRFFEGRTFAEMGAHWAISEDAARMRVDRAMDKLRPLLARRGITSSVAALSGALATQAVAAVPAGLAAGVTSAIGAAALPTAMVAAGIITMTKLQIGLGLTAIGAACAGLVWQHHSNRQLETELAALRQVRVENGQLQAELKRLSASTASTATPPAASAPNDPGHTVAATGETSKAMADESTMALAAGLVPVETLGNGGRDTPRAAFATQLWAARTGDIPTEADAIALTANERAALQAIMPKLPANIANQYDTPEKLMAFALAGSPHPVGGMEIVGQTDEGPDDVVLDTRWQHADDTIVHQSKVHLKRSSTGWKMVVPALLVDRAVAYLTNGT